jgi:hypothetical protein
MSRKISWNICRVMATGQKKEWIAKLKLLPAVILARMKLVGPYSSIQSSRFSTSKPCSTSAAMPGFKSSRASRYPKSGSGAGGKKKQGFVAHSAVPFPDCSVSQTINQIAQSLIWIYSLMRILIAEQRCYLADNPKVENLTTSDGFLNAD